jgi:hypothetical protein
MCADGPPPGPTGFASRPADQLRPCIEQLYGAAAGALAHADPTRSYLAIAGLSGHLAAMRRVVFPVASRQPGPGSWLVTACRAKGRDTEWALRRFECLLSGQSRAVRLPPGSIRTLLDEQLRDYRAAEHALLARLEKWLTGHEHSQLTAGYRTMLRHAPTRPHPRCPHTGPLAGLMFRACALRDRLLDTMDSRPAPPAP